MYAYEITYWDEVENKELNDHGIAYGEDYANASKNVADYYGEKNVIELTLFALEQEKLISASTCTLPSYEEMKKSL